MNHFIDGFIAEQKNVEYCVYCNSIRPQMAKSCCGEQHFVLFRNMDRDHQESLAQREYEWAQHGENK
jgi:hypothetical protein